MGGEVLEVSSLGRLDSPSEAVAGRRGGRHHPAGQLLGGRRGGLVPEHNNKAVDRYIVQNINCKR